MSSETPPRIGLFGLFGCGNSGNDGSLAAMVAFLRRVRPDAELVCICPNPDGLSADHGIPGIAIGSPGWRSRALRRLDRALMRLPQLLRGWARTIGEVRRLDLLVVPGTGILDDFTTGPRGVPYGLFRWCASAWACGVPVWLVSIGAGPIHHRVSRWLLKAAAATAAYRSYRDTVSRRFMLSIGFDALNDPVYPDLAFGLPRPPPIMRRRPTDLAALAVGVGVMRYSGWQADPERGAAIYHAYLQKMVAFVVWLLQEGHRVRILMGDTMDAGAVGDLRAAVAAVWHQATPDQLRAEPTFSLSTLMMEIARCDVVVATRFHNVVCSLKLGRPIISIGYADKNDALLAQAGLGAFCQQIERLDVALLIDQFRRLVRDRARLAARIRVDTAVFHEQLAEQERRLEAMLPPAYAAESAKRMSCRPIG